MGEEVCARAVAAGERVLWFAHRRELVEQAASRISTRLGAMNVGRIHPQAPRTPYAQVQVASVQTLLARPPGSWPKAELVVLDECFPAGTRVDGRLIESIQPGDRVVCLDQAAGRFVRRAVVRTFKRRPTSLLTVHTRGGRLTCTADHPILVLRGDVLAYIEAKHLSARDEVLRVRGGIGPSDDTLIGSRAAWERVDRVEVHEPTSDGTFGGRCPDGHVYNLEVEERHNYVADGIVVHNCHHFAADDWRSLVDHYPEQRVLGLTATPERSDGRALGDIFDKLVVAATHRQLIRDGWLLPCTVFAPARELGAGLALDPVEAYRRYADNDLAFVFAGSVLQARELAQRFSDAGYPAEMVAGVTSTGARSSAIGRFATGELKVLTTVLALTEGIDLPAARVCILARGCGHVTPYLQMVGRVLRPHPSMASAIFIDLPGVSATFGHPTEDRVYSLEGTGIRRASEEPLFTCAHCGVVVPRSDVRGVCPECGRSASAEEANRLKPPRIYSMELRSTYAGEGTPESAKNAECKRLRDVANTQGYSLEWVRREYRLLFGSDPPLDDVSEDHRRAAFTSFQELAKKNNYKPAYAAVRYKKLFGSWPPRGWGQIHA